MAVVRVVLAVVLSAALLGVSIPAAERVERDRNAALATGEFEDVADAGERLMANNDPVSPGSIPAGVTLVVAPPQSWFTDGGRVRIGDDLLRWQPAVGPDRNVDIRVPLRVETPLVLTERTRLRLSLIRVDGTAAVHVERAKVET